jgi:hypothetical protein
MKTLIAALLTFVAATASAGTPESYHAELEPLLKQILNGLVEPSAYEVQLTHSERATEIKVFYQPRIERQILGYGNTIEQSLKVIFNELSIAKQTREAQAQSRTLDLSQRKLLFVHFIPWTRR